MRNRGVARLTAALKLVPDPNYFDSLCDAMFFVAQHPKAIFMGQGVGNPGTTMSDTFRNVPNSQLLEMPVAEDMQMGMAIGMALEGYLPVCVFPRWNFLLCAANQLVNHLDRLPLYSGYRPKVIIRTAVPSTFPFNPGPQHDDDFTAAFSAMLRTVKVVKLHRPAEIVPAYEEALWSTKSTLLVEFTDNYKNARAR
jgi:pyruvate/2-oxoglutarate/acetoin dehydrogenase E1 component